MNSGEIIIHGHAGDIIGLSARGGKIFVRDECRLPCRHSYEGISGEETGAGHRRHSPGLSRRVHGRRHTYFTRIESWNEEVHQANYVGTGMHGGVIYLRGKINENQLGKEVGMAPLEKNDFDELHKYVVEYSTYFGCQAEKILAHDFVKLFPRWLRPYGRLYAYQCWLLMHRLERRSDS